MKIRCKYCDIELTDDLEQVHSTGPLSKVDRTDFIRRGYYFIGDGDYYTGSENQIIINKADLKTQGIIPIAHD